MNGSEGSLAFDFDAMNELSFYDGADRGSEAGFRRILVTEPDHPYLEAWWPAGHLLGYEHAFTHEMVDLVTDIAAGRSSATGRWESVMPDRTPFPSHSAPSHSATSTRSATL